MVNFADMQTAATRIKGVAHRTPILTGRTLNATLGREVFTQAENRRRSARPRLSCTRHSFFTKARLHWGSSQ
jgi:hypothetical protein